MQDDWIPASETPTYGHTEYGAKLSAVNNNTRRSCSKWAMAGGTSIDLWTGGSMGNPHATEATGATETAPVRAMSEVARKGNKDPVGGPEPVQSGGCHPAGTVWHRVKHHFIDTGLQPLHVETQWLGPFGKGKELPHACSKWKHQKRSDRAGHSRMLLTERSKGRIGQMVQPWSISSQDPRWLHCHIQLQWRGNVPEMDDFLRKLEAEWGHWDQDDYTDEWVLSQEPAVLPGTPSNEEKDLFHWRRNGYCYMYLFKPEFYDRYNWPAWPTITQIASWNTELRNPFARFGLQDNNKADYFHVLEENEMRWEDGNEMYDWYCIDAMVARGSYNKRARFGGKGFSRCKNKNKSYTGSELSIKCQGEVQGPQTYQFTRVSQGLPCT